MTLTFGYEMETAAGGPGHLVNPPMLSKKITFSSAGNTNRWLFYGTRDEILSWIRDHKDIVLENAIFPSGRPTSFITHSEIVIDLQNAQDPEQSYYDYFKSFVVSDYRVERVRVELRPRIESKDAIIPTLCRVIVVSGVRLGDIVDELEREWEMPSKSYYQQAVDVFNDNPGPVHVLSADAPSSVRIDEHAVPQ